MNFDYTDRTTEPSWKQEFVHQVSFLLTYSSAMVTALAINSAITEMLHEQKSSISSWKLWIYAGITFCIGMTVIAFMSRFDRKFGYSSENDPAKKGMRTVEPTPADLPKSNLN